MEEMNAKLQISDKLFIIQLLDRGSEFLYYKSDWLNWSIYPSLKKTLYAPSKLPINLVIFACG